MTRRWSKDELRELAAAAISENERNAEAYLNGLLGRHRAAEAAKAPAPEARRVLVTPPPKVSS